MSTEKPLNLTPRDRQVLELLCQGCTNKEIAEQLQMALVTVKQHIRIIALKNGICPNAEGRLRVVLVLACKAVPAEDSTKARDAWDSLTNRERMCAALAASGKPNKQIAAEMRISVQGVKNYLRRAYDRLGVWSRLELAIWYRAHIGGCNE